MPSINHNPVPDSGSSARAQRRARQSRRLARHLKARITEWVEDRRKADNDWGKNSTQLAALEATLLGALERVGIEVDALDASPKGTDEQYRQCRVQEQRLAWIERVWLWYRAKFNQRDDKLYAPALNAADEVLWSCYKPPFEATGQPIRSAPLPYLEPLFSPLALPRESRPSELTGDVDAAFLAKCLAAIPVPVIALPTSTVDEPWWLIFLAHEAGHQVQHDLGSAHLCLTEFPALLGQTAKSVQPLPDSPKPSWWRVRHEEIFADLYSVLCVGPAAAVALAEYLHGVADEPESFRSDNLHPYPPLLARLALMAGAFNALRVDTAPPDLMAPWRDELKGATVIQGDADEERRALASMVKLASPMVDAALRWTPVSGTSFLDWLDWRPSGKDPGRWSAHGFSASDSGEPALIDRWRQALVNGDLPDVTKSLSHARCLMAAGVLAWSDLSIRPTEAAAPANDGNQKPNGADAFATLAQNILEAIPGTREDGYRAGPEVLDGGGEFGELLFTEGPVKMNPIVSRLGGEEVPPPTENS